MFPYPEATAITEVLVTGEKGGSQAKLLLVATAISGVYDFLRVTTFQVWKEYLDFQFVPAVRMFIGARQSRRRLRRHRIHSRIGLRDGPAQLDDPVRRRRALHLVLVPLVWMIGREHTTAVYPASIPIAQMTATQIFRGYVRFVGVGAIATAAFSASSNPFALWRARSAWRRAPSVPAKPPPASAPTATCGDDRPAGVIISAVAVGALLGTLSSAPA